jgi:hypothetical protein
VGKRRLLQRARRSAGARARPQHCDDQRGCSAPGAVISHSFWQREYGGDKNVIGRKVTLNDKPFDIVGVTPASFFGLEVGRTFDVALPTVRRTRSSQAKTVVSIPASTGG